MMSKSAQITPVASSPDARALQVTEEALYASIVQSLLDGRLPPGTPLRERHIAEAFEVTRGMVRKVLTRLGQEGKLDVHPNRGAYVPTPTAEQVRDVYQARIALECGMLLQLAPRITPSQLRRMSGLLKEEHRAAQAQFPRNHAVQLAGDFHVELSLLLDSPTLTSLCQSLVARTQMYVALYEPRNASGCAADEHAPVLEALRRHDGAAAASAMEAHLRKVQERVLQNMTRLHDITVVDVLRSALHASP